MTNYAKTVVTGTIIVFAFSMSAAFLGYLIRFLLSKNLSIEEFGLFYAVFAFIGLISIFKTMGLDKAIVKYIPEFVQQNENTNIKNAIAYTLLVTIAINVLMIGVLYLIADYLSLHLFKTEAARPVILLLGVAYFFDNIMFVVKNSFQGFKNMKLFSGIDFFKFTAILVIVLIGFTQSKTILVPVLAYVIAPAIACIIFFLVLTRKIFPKWREAAITKDAALFKKLGKYGLIVVLTSASSAVLGQVDTIMLTYFTDLTQVALYNVALPTAKLLLYFSVALGSILFPLTSELWTLKKYESVKQGMRSIYKYTMILLLPMILVLVVFAELIIHLLFGDQYVPSSFALQVLAIGMIFGTIQLIHMNFFMGTGNPTKHAQVFLIGAVLNVILNGVLIPMYGITGAAYATAISYCLMMCVGFYKIQKLLDIGVPVINWMKTSIIAGISLIVMIITKNLITTNVWIEAAVVLIIAGGIYTSLLFLFKVITVKEINQLSKEVFH